MKIKILIIFITISALTGFVWVRFNYSKEFHGKVLGVQDNLVSMEGYFVKGGHMSKEKKEVLVIITPETSLNKTVVQRDHIKDAGKLDPKYLEANKKACDLTGFTRDVADSISDVIVVAGNNILNKDRFEAKEISFAIYGDF